VRGVALTRDRRLAVSASADKTLAVWDVEIGQKLRTLEGPCWSVYGVALMKTVDWRSPLLRTIH